VATASTRGNPFEFSPDFLPCALVGSMINDYQEALKFLYENLPMFQRVGAAALKPDLRNTVLLCERLGDPHKKFKSIHVAGTNGKGSTSHMLASILQSSGYKTGLYTSPHLKEFTERIRIDGAEVSQAFVLDFVKRIESAIREIQPSFFEITVAMAFDYFAQQQVDVAVIEVGLGGRLDSTNVITPLISIITNIGWDHKDILGNSLDLIAFEKAGIIKKSIPVVVSERQQSVEHVFLSKAKKEAAAIVFASDIYRANQVTKPGKVYYDIFKNGQNYFQQVRLPLHGIYQEKNLPGIMCTVDILNTKGFSITEDFLREGLANVIANTNFKGRWQKLAEAPLIICDTGHNQDGVKLVVDQINRQKVAHTHMVWGMVKDKDATSVLQLLPKNASYYFCQAKIPRAMDAHVLAEKANELGLTGEVVPDVNEAIRRALVSAQENDLIFIGGSTFVVAEIDGL
jgi:dihydrofolate synthase/folylpolyglutamate synthase